MNYEWTKLVKPDEWSYFMPCYFWNMRWDWALKSFEIAKAYTEILGLKWKQ